MSAELLEAVRSGDVDSAQLLLVAAIVGLDRVGSVFLEKLLGQSNNCPHDWALICPGYTPEQEP